MAIADVQDRFEVAGVPVDMDDHDAARFLRDRSFDFVWVNVEGGGVDIHDDRNKTELNHGQTVVDQDSAFNDFITRLQCVAGFRGWPARRSPASLLKNRNSP